MRPIKNLSRKATEYCKEVGFNPDDVQEAMNADVVTLYRLTLKSEIRLYDADYNYPYVILDRFNRPVTLK